MRKLRGQAHWLCQSPGGLPPLRQARPAPAQRNQASESILDEERGRAAVPLPLKGLAPLTPIASQFAYPFPIPDKKTDLPQERSEDTFEYVLKKPQVPDLAQ